MPSITSSSPIVSIRMTALTPTAIPDHAQHPPAAPLLLHMVLSHPPPSTVIEICTFNFEHFHQSISFPCSPARFPPPTRFFLFTSHCFHSIHSLQRTHSDPANPLHSLHQQRCNNDATLNSISLSVASTDLSHAYSSHSLRHLLLKPLHSSIHASIPFTRIESNQEWLALKDTTTMRTQIISKSSNSLYSISYSTVEYSKTQSSHPPFAITFFFAVMHCNACLQRYAIPQFILFSSPRF